MQTIFDKLTENLQLIYRKALDADDILTRLRNEGKGKFTAIFPADSGFVQQGKFFKPYVEELATDIQQLNNASPEQQKAGLPAIVKKMELLLSTLSQFRQSIR